MTGQQSHVTKSAQTDWTGIVAHQIGEWSSENGNEDRKLLVICVFSGTTLTRVAKQNSRLVRNYQAAGSPSEHRQRVAQMGQIVVDITTSREAVIAVGQIAAAQWLQVIRLGEAQRLSFLTWPIALYLPFMVGPTWVAFTGADSKRLWREYARELQYQGMYACAAFMRPDRKPILNQVAVCRYAKQGNAEILECEKGAVSKAEEDEYWYPDVSGRERIPLENMRWGLSLCEFVSQVLHANRSAELTEWHERIAAIVRRVDLTAVPWGRPG